MKKTLVLVLAVFLTMSLTAPASAVGSPVAPVANPDTTAPLPDFVVGAEIDGAPEDSEDLPEGVELFKLIPLEEAYRLSPDEQKAFSAAYSSLWGEAPSGMRTQYFYYIKLLIEAKRENDEDTDKPEQKLNITLRMRNLSELVVKQYIDGEWIELESTINLDGTVTVYGVVGSPMAIFTA